MGIFSSLFGKKDNDISKSNNVIPQNKQSSSSNTQAKLHLRGVPDSNGLYPPELVMLAVAEKYKTTETNFPGYLTNQYDIPNPLKMLKDLHSRGYLEIGSAKDALTGFKINELKDIASALGTPVKGKKDDIISHLSNVEEDTLSSLVKDRPWKLTEKGHLALTSNPYIPYFLEKHPYSVTELGVTIWTVNEDFIKNPRQPYRDIIYRQLNAQMNKASITFQKNPHSGSVYTYNYCECHRVMGLFIEEEGKSFINASDLYFQYLFKRINIHAGMQLLIGWNAFKNDKKYQAELIGRYYEEIQLLPFHKTELFRLIDELGIASDELYDALITSFKRANDQGIMTEKEAADFIVLELSGEVDRSRELAENIARKAVKKLK